MDEESVIIIFKLIIKKMFILTVIQLKYQKKKKITYASILKSIKHLFVHLVFF